MRTGTARIFCIAAFNVCTYVDGSIVVSAFELSKNSPGTCNVVPYTGSAALQLTSSFKAVRIPNSTMGSVSVHRAGL